MVTDTLPRVQRNPADTPAVGGVASSVPVRLQGKTIRVYARPTPSAPTGLRYLGLMTTHRKLSAILAADAVGYSRLMADDDAETLRALNESRALFRKRIEAHGGRLIDTAGDSVLAEFPSAVEAVDCADEIQHELAKRNA